MDRMVHVSSFPLLCESLGPVVLEGCWAAVFCPWPALFKVFKLARSWVFFSLWPFLCKHLCVHAFLLLQRKTEEKYFLSCLQISKGGKKSAYSKNSRVALFFFEACDGWSWSIIQKLVKDVIQDEASKSKINYPPAASEFSSTSYHKDAPCTNVSMGNTCCSHSYSLALCIAGSVLLPVRLMLSYGEFPFLWGRCSG